MAIWLLQSRFLLQGVCIGAYNQFQMMTGGSVTELVASVSDRCESRHGKAEADQGIGAPERRYDRIRSIRICVQGAVNDL